jgi:hypothetical protein
MSKISVQTTILVLTFNKKFMAHTEKNLTYLCIMFFHCGEVDMQEYMELKY